MKKVITYGTYDLFHYGHQRLLERAKALGDYLIVGVTADDFDKARGKINVEQSLMERIEAVKKTGLADEVIVEEYEGQKIDDIQRYDVDIFAIGSDWVGKFDYLNEYCQVVYLDRTQGVSSTELRAERNLVKLGLVGRFNGIRKYATESSYVNGLKVTGGREFAKPYLDALKEMGGMDKMSVLIKADHYAARSFYMRTWHEGRYDRTMSDILNRVLYGKIDYKRADRAYYAINS